MDAWTRDLHRDRDIYRAVEFIGGLAGTPLFLLLAGVTLGLALGKRVRRGLSPSEAASLARRRGWQVLGLAFAFRLQAWLISGGGLQTLLKVDILNVMGLSMVAAALLWRHGGWRWSGVTCLAAAALAVAMVTPVVHGTPLPEIVPDFLEAYVRPLQGPDGFTLFPWAGFLLAGAAVGLCLDGGIVSDRERAITATLGAVGGAVLLIGYTTSLLPAMYAGSDFWTNSPTFFLIRLGVVMAMIPFAFLLNGTVSRSPLCRFGRSSLFVYWIHVEMAYGSFSAPLRRALPFEGAYAGFLALTALLFALVLLKDRASVRWAAAARAHNQNTIMYVIFAMTARLMRLPVKSSRRSL
jgi:uncharacterized membrane protein